ncbi:MAG: hypothetical protein CBC71_04330 [Rhodobacteraceae bacterium TMED111]|nr:hypothetical protein [Marinovum sp.]OUV42283.1 MAG: hypothetical protein CBC71_04330 [Rhodobacteraceae bacterium TMED111]|tara:strand:+ start:1689 stop:2717 length:1029 start_codon:yes stop_codon:yes gene_type:complete
MATPQETRDRINEMRARIFNEASPDPVPNNAAVPNKDKGTLRDNNSVEHNARPSQKNGASSVTAQIIDLQADTFVEKLKDYDNRISSLSEETKNKLAELNLLYDSKINDLEESLLNKLETALEQNGKKIDRKIDDVNTSILNEVSSIRASHGQKFDALEQEVNLLDEKLQTDNDEVKALVLDQKALLEKTISDNIAASNKQMDAQFQQIEDRVKSFEKDHDATTVRLSEEIKSLSGELTILNNLVKEKHFEIASHVDINMSTITKAIENDREYFNHKLQTASDNIQAVEAMIVKEDDLTKLFENYTLNVNIRNDVKPSKFILFFKKFPLLSTLKKLLPAKTT